MRRFLVTCHKAKPADPFRMEEPEESYQVFIIGLQPLQGFIRALYPPGYKVRSKRWFGRHVRRGYTLHCKNAFFDTSMFDIMEVGKTNDNRKLHTGAIILQLPLKETA